ncbi:MAG: response regulator [Alphaproteobacteria bacterium]|nr:response regulator [Alphaproteobacteria bacterium]
MRPTGRSDARLLICASRDNPRGVNGAIVYLIDTSAQKRFEEQYAQSQKLETVGQIAGGIAHDFNNLLTAMLGFCDLLLLRHEPGDQSFADIMQIKQNANRAANLVRQLLAFSRQQTLQPKVLNLTGVLAELAHLLRRLIGENIELTIVHDRDLGLIKADQTQLEQVIINLAATARDAMAAGGRLTLRTSNVDFAEPTRFGGETIPPGGYVLMEVTGTGVGIAEEHLAKIFEPLFSTKALGAGTGLGLSTVYGIVKQTGGFIVAASEEGRGATFRIYLLRHAPEAVAAAPAAAESGPERRDLTGKGSVLLVEDKAPVRVFAARALTNKGYTVVEADSGEATLAHLERGGPPFDLLISDVVMPGMDDPTLLRAARALQPGVKAVLISGYAEEVFRRSLGREEGVVFLGKPFSLKDLAATVKAVIAGERPT